MASATRITSDFYLNLADAASDRLDQWRTTLLQLASGSVPGVAETSFLGVELRAAAIVATMAELEHVLRDSMYQLSFEVNASGTVVRDLKSCLRALAMHARFDSLTNTRNADTAWSQRSVLTTLETSNEVASLPLATAKVPQPPLDGRTIRPGHILRIWSVLGIAADPFPAAGCQTSLAKLALLRNDLAHRNVPVGEVFRQPATSAADIAQYLDDIELLVMHLGNEMTGYATSRAYRV